MTYAADSDIAKLLGPLATLDSILAMNGSPKTWLDNFHQYEPGHYDYGVSTGTNYWASSNYYDRAKIYYATSFATAGEESEEWLRKANELALNYRMYYAPTGGVSSHWSMPQGVYLHWLMTDDEASKTWCLKVAENMSTGYMYSQLGLIDGEMDNRIQGRVLEALILAFLITSGDPLWGDKLREALPLILSTQQEDGSYPFTQVQGGGNKPFMVGILNDALILYERAFEKDARIRPAIEKSIDYMWENDWRPEAKGFIYDNAGTADSVPAPDLNNLIINGFAAIAMDDRVDQILEGSLTAWLDGDKQFNQAYSFAYQTIARMNGAESAWEGQMPEPGPEPEPPDEDLDIDAARDALHRAQSALIDAREALKVATMSQATASAAVASALRFLPPENA